MEPQINQEISQQPVQHTEKKFVFTTPMAIVIAGIVIAAAVLFTQKNTGGNQTANLPKLEIKDTDHVNGDLSKAKVIMYEYSDSDCPFCERFHPIMKQIKAEYGDKVAWVYRHYPLPTLHPYAPFEALALECVNKAGGNSAFWNYLDKLYTVNLSTSKDKTPDQKIYTKLATEVGIDAAAFQSCYDAREFETKIISDATEAQNLGAQGTPYTIIANKRGTKQIPIPGAYPIEKLRETINSLL